MPVDCQNLFLLRLTAVMQSLLWNPFFLPGPWTCCSLWMDVVGLQNVSLSLSAINAYICYHITLTFDGMRECYEWYSGWDAFVGFFCICICLHVWTFQASTGNPAVPLSKQKRVMNLFQMLSCAPTITVSCWASSHSNPISAGGARKPSVIVSNWCILLPNWPLSKPWSILIISLVSIKDVFRLCRIILM